MTDQTYITGWDIGGAHLKAARCNTQGQLIDIIEVACPLWKGLDQLGPAITKVQQQLANTNDIAAITMTAELVDIFANRQTGVQQLLDYFSDFIPPSLCYVYGAEKGWLSPDQAKQHWYYVASRNWQASATLAANYVDNGIFIDVGSTTSDIIPLCQGQASPTGFSDFERQKSRELLYTGAIRTPLIALANAAPFNGHSVGLAAELFANTADCWFLLGQLNAEKIRDLSCDGQPWDIPHCQQRLARLLGTDAHQHTTSQWLQLASWFAQQQLNLVADACQQVISAHPGLQSEITIVGAGIGRFIVKLCAERLSFNYKDFDNLLAQSEPLASDHAAATAVALLAQQQLT